MPSRACPLPQALEGMGVIYGKINYTQVAWPLENLHTALEYINKV